MTQNDSVSLHANMELGGKYRLIEEIGRGSFGDVWLAIDNYLNRECAVKVLPPGTSVDERLREAKIGNQLEHKNLVHVYQADVVPIEGKRVVILAMKYQPNGSSETLANKDGYLPLPQVLKIGREILQGLEYLHTQEFYHNDIKPGNILLDSRGQAMLSDYGITGVSSSNATVIAPGAYGLHRAPEVISASDISARSDIFQVGMTLARLLIRLDFLEQIRTDIGIEQYKKDIAAGKLLTKRTFGSHIPANIRRVVLKAVHPDPAQRYSSAHDMRRALNRLKHRGYWTVNEAGIKVGKCGKYVYSHSIESGTGRKFNVACRKHNIFSGNVQCVTKYCGSGMTKGQADRLIAKFEQFVVTGK